jgi:hypothetical protein
MTITMTTMTGTTADEILANHAHGTPGFPDIPAATWKTFTPDEFDAIESARVAATRALAGRGLADVARDRAIFAAQCRVAAAILAAR